MDKNDIQKIEKNGHTIEITIPFNGATSESKPGSISSNTDMSNMNSNNNNDTSKKGQINNESGESNSSEDSASKKGQMSNESDESNSSNDTTSKKEQIIINISR